MAKYTYPAIFTHEDSFFYRGNSDYRLPEFQRLFLQHCTPFD